MSISLGKIKSGKRSRETLLFPEIYTRINLGSYLSLNIFIEGPLIIQPALGVLSLHSFLALVLLLKKPQKFNIELP